MTIKFTFLLNCIFLLFLSNVGIHCQVVSADNREEVKRLLELPLQENVGYIKNEIRRIGSPAMPILVEIVNTKTGKMSFTKRTFLMGLIGELADVSCCNVVTELLKNESADIRGDTIKLIASKKDKHAISKIIALLDDKEIFTTNVRTDPYQEEDISVSDVALSALSEITGIQIDKNLDENIQIQFWQNWWNSQAKKKEYKSKVRSTVENAPFQKNGKKRN